jgi:myosin-9
VTRTTEFTDPKDVLIADVSELHYLETFLNKKISLIDDSKSASSKESVVDVIFKSALKEFKKDLISTYSVAAQDPHQLRISYKNLIDNFEQVMMHVCQRENTYKSFPVIMGVNAFRGFLDEFRTLAAKCNLSEKNKHKNTPQKRRRTKMSKKVKEDSIQFNGHVFKAVQANIPTVCEVCSSLMWLMEKVWVCQGCKLTCHKKCTSKVSSSCKLVCYPGQRDQHVGCFGVPLDRLVDDEHRVPQVIEDLMTAIELKGLYTEGLYRKSGIASKIIEVKSQLDKLDKDSKLDWDLFPIHVLTGVLKSFFREMPEPLMTFELYDDFLWASTTSDPQERVQAIYSHISKLPRAHFDLLERLSFHLARVAQHEQSNRMSANSLAIVMAPCVLRTDRPMQMQEKLSDISKQTM